MTPPEGMSPEHYARVLAVRWDDSRLVANPVLERAAIIHEATGCTWPEADARAWDLHGPGQRALF